MLTVDFNTIGLEAGDVILDLGCGEGRHTINAYLDKPVHAIGVDLCHNDLKTAHERSHAFTDTDDNSRKLSLSVANALELPFADNTFDKVICSEVLEHIPDYVGALKEINRVLKPGGIFAASVPRFGPEIICWALSDEYHAMEGGHIRIFNAKHLRDDITNTGMVHFKKHYAHSLHVPYWWLKCLFWREQGQPQAKPVELYHQFLIWDLMKQPAVTRFLDWILNPILGKSVVMYFVKLAPPPAPEASK